MRTIDEGFGVASSYYGELRSESDDPARQVGWRHRIEQAYRFEAALECIRAAPGRVLDVGCGLGALAQYLGLVGESRDWLGIECEREFALAAGEHGDVIFAGFEEVDLSSLEVGCAVAIGTLACSGRPGYALADLIEFVSAAPAFCVILLDRDGIARRPAIALEHHGSGADLAALEAIGAALHQNFDAIQLSPTDLALFGWNGDRPAIRTTRSRFHVTVEGPWGAPEPADRKAWLASELGLEDEARYWLAQAETSSALASVVRERIEVDRQ